MPDAEALFEKARRGSKGGWRLQELERLYRGFGFEIREGSKHMLFTHPKYPHLMATVTRSKRELPTGYVQEAVRIITELKRLGEGG